MVTVFLVRHGPTGANRDVVYAGRVEDALLPESSDAISETAEFFAGKSIKRIITSPQRRARDSALPLVKMTAISATVEDALSEMEMGPWTGLDAAQISAKYPAEWEVWRSTPEAVVLQGFEGLKKVEKRAVSWLEGTTQSYEESIVAFTHETVIKVLVGWVTGARLSAYRRLLVPNCSVSSVQFDGNEWRLRSLNEFVPMDRY